MADPSDEELLDTWSGGDARAGGELFKRHFDAMYRFFANKISSDAVVEDLVQQSFERLVVVRERFQGASSFRSFMFGVAHNVLREYIRSRQRASKREAELEDTRAVDLGDGPVTIMVREAEMRRLLMALRRLPIEMQVLLELHYFERLKGRELGEILQTNENTIRSRLRAARERLLGEYEELLGAGGNLETTVTDIDAWAEGIRARLV